MKVLMAEDLKSVRERLSGLLAESGEVELRFMAQEAMPVLQSAAAWLPEVVILDIRMRGMLTLEVLEVLKHDWPDTVVVVSAFFYEPYYRQAYITHGADFFFDKSLDWNELITFLRKRQAQAASSQVDILKLADRMTGGGMGAHQAMRWYREQAG